jgi:hypothetical protein
MPAITYTSEVDARTLRSNGPALSPDAFGASIGRAVQGAGQDFMQAGNNIAAIEEQRRKEKLASAVAGADFTAKELEIRNTVGADAAEYQKQVSTAYDDWVNEEADKLDDDKLRTQFRLEMAKDKKPVLARSAMYQYQVAAEDSELEANTALSSLQNRIAQHPEQYDELREKGGFVIAARPGLPQAKKKAMIRQWEYDSANRRFDGMLSKATTAAQLDALAAELANPDGTGRDWQSEMNPKDYETLVNQIGTLKKSYQSQAKTAATAAVGTLEDRNKNTVTLVPVEELQDAQEQVAASGDPLLQKRVARVTRNQQILKESMRLPPAELKASINAANGNPGLAYPGLPPELSDDINKAQEKFGVNVGYMGGSLMREYGEYFKDKKPLKLDEKFKPQVAHEGVDLRNLRSDVVDAVTVAGQAFGKPLIVTKGAGSAGLAGVDVSTVGMSPQDKAKLAGSLVDAGFTGVAEYDGYMRFDMRSSVPQNFGKEVKGQFWGGWTALSPEVVKTLQEKGFGAGIESSVLKRKGAAREGIDYGKPTGIKNEKGEPTSTAVGVLQFVEGTWWGTPEKPGILRKPGMAEVIKETTGVDISKMTDVQILELRKNPHVSIMVGAAYAAENKKTLEGSLGRDVSDAEIHMAHFMGAGGAVQFLTKYKNNPDAIAADFMPEAAKANKGVFYRKGQALTVREIYGNIADDFGVSPSQVAFEDNEMRQRILENTQKALAHDPIAHASSVGSHTVLPLFEDGGFEARGNTAKSVAQYYNIPTSDMKPFTEDEAAYLKDQLDVGNANKQVEIMASIQSMGSNEVSRAAMKQIGEKDPIFQQAGDLYLDGNVAVATEIAKGRKMLIDNPALKDQMGATPQEINDLFVRSTGAALFGIPPMQRQAVQDSAVAYWASRYSGRVGGKLDSDSFGASIQAVSGGSKDAPIIDDVNGSLTLLPPGVRGDDMEDALRKMTLNDFVRMSDNALPPLYSDGGVVSPLDIQDEVMLRAIGGGKYHLILDDGTALITDAAAGQASPYIFVPKPEDLRRVINRPTSALDQKARGAPDVPVWMRVPL